MTIMEMLQQSVVLTIFGMVVVFSFLWIMTICISLTGKIFIASNQKKGIVSLSSEPTGATATGELTAAITAAIVEYQKESAV